MYAYVNSEPCCGGPCRHGMACPLVAVGGRGLQVWTVLRGVSYLVS
jgi:hypothetical protein